MNQLGKTTNLGDIFFVVEQLKINDQLIHEGGRIYVPRKMSFKYFHMRTKSRLGAFEINFVKTCKFLGIFTALSDDEGYMFNETEYAECAKEFKEDYEMAKKLATKIKGAKP